MRHPLASLCVLTALAATAAAGSPSSGQAPASARTPVHTLSALRAATVAADERLSKLLAIAATDPALRRVRIYAAYSDAALLDFRRETNGGVTVDELLGIAMDKGVPAEIREEALVAMTSPRATAKDPAYGLEGRRAARPRAKFSLKVVKYLSDAADLISRSFAHRLLQALWPEANDEDIRSYDPRKRETWGNARAAWTRFLT